jgi:hypothetical protein
MSWRRLVYPLLIPFIVVLLLLEPEEEDDDYP